MKTIYAIQTTDDERRSSIKAYCATYDIALREAKNYHDWFSSYPANEKNIIPITVIGENEECEERKVAIKSFKFPTFEEWEKRENKVRVELGAYCCEVRAFSWGSESTIYMLAASLSDRNPLNIYTNQLFSRRFEYDGDNEKLKEWYETATSEFNAFFENHIKSTYIVE